MINDYKKENKPFPFDCYMLVAEKPKWILKLEYI